MIKKLESIMKCMLLLVVVGALIVPSATAETLYPDDELGDNVAGNVSTHNISFELDAPLPADGKIKTGFNPGFDTSLFTNDSAVYVTQWNNLPLDGTYTWTRDSATNEIIITRAGGTEVTWGPINFTLGNITNPTTSGNKGVSVRTTTSVDIPIDIGTTTVTIVPRWATQFTLGTVSNHVAGTPFTVTVTAKDQFGNVNTGFENYTAVLSSTIGAINPYIMDNINGSEWTNGVWVGDNEVITKTGTGTITATSGSVTGTSNTFTVTPAALGSFEIATIPAQFDELAFTVTAQAKDTQGNNKTNYNAVNNLTVTPGLPGTVTIVSPSPATVQFVNGVYSGQVTLNVVPDPTPTALQTGVKLTITNVTLSISKTSNGFSISLPVDLKNSTVKADPVIVIEDGVSTSTITVTVKNGINQQNISGATVVLKSDRVWWMDSIVPASNTTDSNGQATFRVSSETPGKANLTATVWGTEVLEKKPVVTFGFDNKLRLNKDWNLVSVPRKLDNSSVSALNTNKVDKIFYYDAGNREWKSAFYTSGNWSGTLTTIDDGKGYWMNATAPADVQVVLKTLDPLQLPPDYPLKAGWNMVGYTSLSLNLNTDINEYFSSLRHPGSGEPIWVSAYIWENGGYRQAKPWWQGWNSFSNAMRTEGYWVYLNSDGILVP